LAQILEARVSLTSSETIPPERNCPLGAIDPPGDINLSSARAEPGISGKRDPKEI
jgi:hypothetical protein